MAASSTEICNNALTLIGARRIVSVNDPSKEGRACNDNYDISRKALLRLHPWNFATMRKVFTRTVISSVVDDGSGQCLVTTATAHGLTIGDLVIVEDVAGTTEVNTTGSTISANTTTSFTLPIAFVNAYTSGGYCLKTSLFGYKYKFTLPSDFLRIHTLADTADVALAEDEWKIEGLFLLTDYTDLRLRYIFDCSDTTLFDALFDEAVALMLATKIAFKISGSEMQVDNLQRRLRDVVGKARFVDSVEEPSRQMDSDEWIRARWTTNQGYVRDPGT